MTNLLRRAAGRAVRVARHGRHLAAEQVGRAISAVRDAPAAWIVPRQREAMHQRARAEMQQRFPLHGREVPETTFSLSDELPFTCDAALERAGNGIRVLLSSAAPKHALRWLPDRLPTYVYWLNACPPEVKRLTVVLDDGHNPMSAQFAPSTNLASVTAIADPYYFQSHGFSAFREHSIERAVAWSDRSSELVWRGATTGTGLFDPRLTAERPEMAAQRMQMCVRLRDVPGTDAKFAYSEKPQVPVTGLEHYGLRGAKIDEHSWVGRKYALDVDGNTNTWSNLIVRLHLGCCVLKVRSRYDYRQWYYDRLKPWEHYVPVAEDCSDLLDRIEWVRTNDREAEQIARRGQQFARSLTWEAVEAETVALICANWDRPQAG